MVSIKKPSVFNYSDFAQFLSNEVEKASHSKRGEKKEIAEYLNLHPTSLSQVFSGTRMFTDEQVYLLGEYLGLSELEGEYVLILHQIYCTQNKKFRDMLIKKRETIKKRSLNLSERVQKDKALTDEEKSIFYSSWQYTSIWVYISLEGGKTRDEISARLDISKKRTGEILEFLIRVGMCRFEKGRFCHRVNRVHLEKASPLLKQHHSNWRIKAIQKMDRSDEEDFTFTAPLSLSKKDFGKLREEMVALIQKVSDTVTNTEPEEIYSLSMDFIKI